MVVVEISLKISPQRIIVGLPEPNAQDIINETFVIDKDVLVLILHLIFFQGKEECGPWWGGRRAHGSAAYLVPVCITKS